jgi:hypothetical protein
MNELISKQAAIDTVYERIKQIGYENSLSILSIGQAIQELPSTQPPYQYSEAYVRQIRGERDILQDMVDNMTEPKTGKWIKSTGMMPPEYHGHYECSVCGCYAMRDWKRHKMVLSAYCPNCGAKMLNGGK